MLRMLTTCSIKCFSVPVSEYGRLFTALARLEFYPDIVSLSRKMELLTPQKPDIYVLSIVINSFCNLNRVDFGFSVLGIVIKLGYRPNVVIFTTLIKGLCARRKNAEAVHVIILLRIEDLNQRCVLTPGDPYMPLLNDEIIRHVSKQALDLFPSSQGLEVTWSSVVKIGQSLYLEGPGKDSFRPDQKTTPISNFFLSGSYTKQDYIDSMEGATLSGRQTSAYVCNAGEELVTLRKTLANIEGLELRLIDNTVNNAAKSTIAGCITSVKHHRSSSGNTLTIVSIATS